MKRFKFFFSILALAVVLPALAGPNPATYQVVTLAPGWTACTAAKSSNSTLATIDVRKQEYIAVQAQFAAAGATTSDVTFRFEQSLDGVNWTTANGNKLVWAVPANGTTMVYATTNWNIGGVGYIRLAHITNAAAEDITNVYVKVAYKISDP